MSPHLPSRDRWCAVPTFRLPDDALNSSMDQLTQSEPRSFNARDDRHVAQSPYSLSDGERPQSARAAQGPPTYGQSRGCNRILAVRPSDAAGNSTGAARPSERTTRCRQLLVGRVRHALRVAEIIRCPWPPRHQSLRLDERAMCRRLPERRRARRAIGLGFRRPQLVSALFEGGGRRGGGGAPITGAARAADG